MSDATTALAAAEAAAASASTAGEAATGAAESVATALEHRNAAQAAAQTAADNAVAAVGPVNDTVMTSVDGDAGSAFRVQSDARLLATIASEVAAQAPGAVETEANDPNSGLRGILNGVYRPAVPRIADIPTPFIIPHRGAGAFLAPENTLAAFKIGASLGFGIIDGGDWAVSADDTLVCNHDTTVDFLTTKTGNVSAYSAMALANMTVDAASWFGGTFPDTKLTNDGEFLNTFGGLIPFAPEPKVARAADLLAARIETLGLQQSVLPNSFTRAWLQPFLDIGCPDVFLNLSVMPSAPTRAQYLADGVNWLGITYDGTITPADATTLAAEGFNLVLGTVSRKYHLTQTHDWASVIGLFSAFVSDDPVYFHHALDATKVTRYRLTTDPFDSGTYYHGHISDGDSTPAHRGALTGNGRWSLPSIGYVWCIQGWACPLASPTAYNITFNVAFDALGSDTARWVGVWFGADDDRKYSDTGAATENGYQFYFRANGSLNLVKKVAGVVTGGTTTTASTALSAPLTLSAGLAAGVAITSLPVAAIPSNLASGAKLALPTGQTATLSAAATAGATSVSVTSITPSAAIASGASLPQVATFTLAVTSTTVTVTRTDVSPTVNVTKTDNAFRGPYFSMAHQPNGLGMQTSIYDVTIT